MKLESTLLFDDNALLFSAQLKDIADAKSFIYLEIYRFNNDSVGRQFRDLLAEKAKEGVKVKILVDSWGTNINPIFFQPIIKAGGEVRFFQKLKLTFYFFSKNHRRNHRKLLIIDNKISYIGSSNITAYSLSWKELNLRISDPITRLFCKAFTDNYALYRKFDLDKMRFKKNIKYGDLIIMQEIPSLSRQRLKKKYEALIHSAKEEVIVETPYFLPGFKLRKELMDAAQRGVKVKVIIPKHSDVLSVDIIRRRYYGLLYQGGVEFHFFLKGNLHAKSLFIDKETFSISSANFDYRSFRHQHEISFIGKEENISAQLNDHLQSILEDCEPFDYERWLNRSRLEKFIEWLLLPLRYLM